MRDAIQDLLDRFLEHMSAAGIDLAPKGEDRYRGDCPACGGRDRLTLEPRHDGSGLYLSCWTATCEAEHILDVLGLGWSDLRLELERPPRGLDLRTPELSLAKPIEWAWQDRIILGRLSLVVGNEGTGKGTVIANLASRLTHGTLPGDLQGAPVNVLIVGNEDLLDDAWTPRLYLAQADLQRVYFQRLGDFEIDFTDAGDVEHLRGWIHRYAIKVVVFDALLDHVGGAGIDEFKAKAIRGALGPLRRLAGEEQIAALGSLHPRKGRVLTFRELVANSHQFNAVSRSSLLLAPHPDDPEKRLLAFGKGNHAGMVPTLEFRIEVVRFELNGQQFRDVRAVDWVESDVDLDEAIRASTGVKDRMTKTASAEDAICAALQNGPRLSSEVKAEVGQKLGCSLATVERAAGDLREDGVLGSEGSTSATKWFLTSLPNSPHLSQSDEVRGVEEVAPEELKTPASTGDQSLLSQPSQLPSPQHFAISEGSGDEGVQSAPNGELSDRERAIEMLRKAQAGE